MKTLRKLLCTLTFYVIYIGLFFVLPQPFLMLFCTSIPAVFFGSFFALTMLFGSDETNEEMRRAIEGYGGPPGWE